MEEYHEYIETRRSFVRSQPSYPYIVSKPSMPESRQIILWLLARDR